MLPNLVALHTKCFEVAYSCCKCLFKNDGARVGGTTAFAATATLAAEEPKTVLQPTTVAAPAATAITKEQAVEMALKAHPGKVTKAYEDTKKGKKTWEVKVLGKDGKRWELHYEIKSGALVSEESK